jgi:hypothetical protein
MRVITKWLHRLGVPSDAAYFAALGSIATSIGVWAWRNEKNVANAERLGIFIGLWAPTFMLIGNALKDEEIAARSEGKEMSGMGGRLQDAVEPRARKVEGAVNRVMDPGQTGT